MSSLVANDFGLVLPRIDDEWGSMNNHASLKDVARVDNYVVVVVGVVVGVGVDVAADDGDFDVDDVAPAADGGGDHDDVVDIDGSVCSSLHDDGLWYCDEHAHRESKASDSF